MFPDSGRSRRNRIAAGFRRAHKAPRRSDNLRAETSIPNRRLGARAQRDRSVGLLQDEFGTGGGDVRVRMPEAARMEWIECGPTQRDGPYFR